MRYGWIAGTKEEIAEAIQALRASGFTFTQGDVLEFYSLSHKTPYGCLLHNFCVPPIPVISTPQPKPWDAVLGGKG